MWTENEVKKVLEKELCEIKEALNCDWAKQVQSGQHQMRACFNANFRGQLDCIRSLAERFYLNDISNQAERMRNEL